MQVSIKDLSVSMEIKNTGIELDVYSADGNTHLGDLIITKTKLIWCEGKTQRTNGKEITWDDFIKLMNNR